VKVTPPPPPNTAPVLHLPGSFNSFFGVNELEVQGNTLGGANVNYQATATDTEDGVLPVSCNPPSGSFFPWGFRDSYGGHQAQSPVQCTVTDSGGLSTSGWFFVVVDDFQPPVLTLPSDITVQATGPDGAVVTYSATAHDVVAGDVPVYCGTDPDVNHHDNHLASGTLFPVGTTTVTCTADDGSYGVVGRFNVTVLPLPTP
jgi:hypothetical protein